MNEVNDSRGKLWTVITSDRDKALKVMSAIECKYNVPVVHRKVSSFRIDVFFEDGVWLRWLKPSDNARGYRHGKLWCDKNVSKEIFDCVILPKYLGKYSDIVWI